MDPLKNSFAEMIELIHLSESANRSADQRKFSALLRAIIDCIPGNVYWKNTQNIYLGCNQNQIDFVGKDFNEWVGYSIYDLFPKTAAQCINQHDSEIMEERHKKVFEEPVFIGNQKYTFLSHKSPMFNRDSEVVGMIGVSMDITAQRKQEQDLKKAKIDFVAHKFRLTQKELECIDHLLVGKTAVEIAKALGISIRTAETHLSNIKDKLYCTSKSQLIAQLMKLGFTPSLDLLV